MFNKDCVIAEGQLWFDSVYGSYYLITKVIDTTQLISIVILDGQFNFKRCNNFYYGQFDWHVSLIA